MFLKLVKLVTEQLPFDRNIWVIIGFIFTKVDRMTHLVTLLHSTGLGAESEIYRFCMLEEIMVLEQVTCLGS